MSTNSKAATQEYLEELHRKLAEHLKEDLQKPHYVDPKTHQEVIPTALYNVINQFLKDNRIVGHIDKDRDDPLSNLARAFTKVVPDGEYPGFDDPNDDNDTPTV